MVAQKLIIQIYASLSCCQRLNTVVSPYTLLSLSLSSLFHSHSRPSRSTRSIGFCALVFAHSRRLSLRRDTGLLMNEEVSFAPGNQERGNRGEFSNLRLRPEAKRTPLYSLPSTTSFLRCKPLPRANERVNILPLSPARKYKRDLYTARALSPSILFIYLFLLLPFPESNRPFFR